MRIRNAAITTIAVVTSLGASACAPVRDDPPQEASIPAFDDTVVPADDSVIVSNALDALPSASPRDWVSYADHVSLFTVLDERELPWGEHEKEYGEGMVGRYVTVRVNELVWRSGTAPEVPGEYTARTDGWALKDGDLSPMGSLGGPRWR